MKKWQQSTMNINTESICIRVIDEIYRTYLNASLRNLYLNSLLNGTGNQLNLYCFHYFSAPFFNQFNYSVFFRSFRMFLIDFFRTSVTIRFMRAIDVFSKGPRNDLFWGCISWLMFPEMFWDWNHDFIQRVSYSNTEKNF